MSKVAQIAFNDMKHDLEIMKHEEHKRLNPFGPVYINKYTWDYEVKNFGDSWVAGASHVITKESKRLNKELKINNYGKRN